MQDLQVRLVSVLLEAVTVLRLAEAEVVVLMEARPPRAVTARRRLEVMAAKAPLAQEAEPAAPQ